MRNIPPEAKVKKHFLFGSAYHLMKDPLNFLQQQRDIHEKAFSLSSPFVDFVVLNDPEMVDYVLRENNKNYVKSKAYETLKLILGNGLITAEGDAWRKQRRLMQPAFYKEKLSAIVTTMIETTHQMLDEWDKKYKDGDWVDISYEMNKIALKIVTRAMFKAEVDQEVDVINKHLPYILEKGADRFKNPLKIPFWVPTLENIREKKSIKAVESVAMKIIEERRKNPGEHQDLLDMLMLSTDEETGALMSDKQLKDEAITIFLAGHETSANALAYFFLTAYDRKDVLENIDKEYDSVLGEEELSGKHLHQLKYLTNCVNETLRLYPPVWAVGRQPLKDDKFGDYDIPVGYQTLICMYSIHRDPKLWEKPNEFMPERFADDKVKQLPKGAYLPFGGGPRLCIGNSFAIYEMQIVLSEILHRFRFEGDPNYKLELVPNITMRPKENIKMKIFRK